METKTGILLSLLVFYSVVLIFIGFYGSTFENVGIERGEVESDIFTFFSNLGIVKGLSNIPLWFNIILFTPLFIILLWIVISSLPTFNGGS